MSKAKSVRRRHRIAAAQVEQIVTELHALIVQEKRLREILLRLGLVKRQLTASLAGCATVAHETSMRLKRRMR